MNLFRHFRDEVIRRIETLTSEDRLPADLDVSRVSIDLPKDPDHGDIATNAAMVLAKPAAMKPRDIAEALAEGLRDVEGIESVEIAGPGFINMRLTTRFWQDRLADVLRAGQAYGSSDLGTGKKVNVEYVSANPTGPLHVGHGRGAVFGDALAALLEKAGYDVTREYYVNDAGAQVDVLARSLYHRYMEALGEDMGEVAEGLYPGDYLVPVGEALAKRDGTRWKNSDEATWLAPVRSFAIDAMMDMIRDDLGAIGIAHAVFSSERALVDAGGVDKAFDFLSGKGLIYEGVLEPPKGKTPDDWEPREQTLFRASDFGDDTDRPLKKSDGSWTYFGTDIAYHYDKFTRGFNDMIDVWGADHGGYVKRMQAAVAAMTDGQGDLDVKLCQMVNLLDDGEPVKMSKRAGTFVTLRDVIDRVGKDVVRFIMLTRKNDAQLDFDFARVTEQSKDNPVFYVQYAHARAYSVRRMALEVLSEADMTPEALLSAPLDRLSDPAELDLIRTLAQWPRLVESAALAHEPHRVAFYLGEVAAAFHGLWNRGKDDVSLRFVIADDTELTRARLALVAGMANVIASGLAVMGVEAVEELR